MKNSEFKKRLIITGAGGSGKDYLRKSLQKRGFSFGVPFTTRPKREKEENGIDYFFISEEEHRSLLSAGFFYEHAYFNNWFYGTPENTFRSSNLFIMTPSSLKSLNDLDRSDSFIVYLDIEEETRRARLSARNDADSTERRLHTDNLDFLNFGDYDLKITDPYFPISGDWTNPENYNP
jgi:guanylate kinase